MGGTYAKLCFNYDVIMRDTTLLYLAYLARDSKRVDMVAEWISDKAFRYGLTSERINIDTLGQVLEIIKTAESMNKLLIAKIFSTNNFIRQLKLHTLCHSMTSCPNVVFVIKYILLKICL